METQDKIEDWRQDISEPKNTIKVKDGETIAGTFLDEGTKRTSADFGASIAFKFKKDGDEEEKLWYVKANNFTLLAQIKALGKLAGQKVKISRIGSKRSDTRYSIAKA